MWKLKKPSIEKATGRDIDELISNCAVLKDTDKSALKTLYTNYDNQGGKVTDNQLATILDNKASAIKAQYRKTYKGEKLEYILTELNEDVDLCPCCSINSVSQLDHFLPSSQFPALAVCRMNLVPLCGVCNNKKNNDDFNKYTHAYYERFPSVPFLIANIRIVNSVFLVEYIFDSVALNNVELETKLNHQATKIDLWTRLRKTTNSYINDLCCTCDVNDYESLVIWLSRQLENNIFKFGLNDWRCAILRGLLQCEGLDVSVVNHYKSSPHRVNDGAGA